MRIASMSYWFNPDTQLEGFQGLVRLFPLPNFVMFPGVVKGLHIFEPRYCQMLKESLATDKLIAMALLQPGWEANYFKHPAIYDVVCIGKVVQHAQTPEGRHNILLSGLKRAKIVSECHKNLDQFRTAQVNLLDDIELSNDAPPKVDYQQRIIEVLRRASETSQIYSTICESSFDQMPLGLLADLLLQAFPFSLLERQEFLSEVRVEKRCERLLKFDADCRAASIKKSDDDKDSDSKDDDSYPPNFSLN